MQELVPDAYMGEDGNLRMLFEVIGGIGESVFRAIAVLAEDMFVNSASSSALEKYGLEFAVAKKLGTMATGSVVFSGAGGAYVPIGTRVGHDPGANADVLYFLTTVDGTIPNPGTPTAPTTAVGSSGALTGLYEHAVTFVTAGGETTIGAMSSALTVTSQRISVSNIPLGGAGTTQRKLYRRLNGGTFGLVTTIADNTTTTYTDNIADGSLTGPPPTVNTATQISLAAQAEDIGSAYNVAIGGIAQLNDVPSAISAVTNPAAFTGGSDEEATSTYRSDILNAIRAPGTGSQADLKYWAESVNGVDMATVFINDNVGTPTNGHTTVRIVGPGGSVPDSTVQADVLSKLNALDIANVTIHVTTFTQVATNVTVSVTRDPNYTLADITPGVTKAITDYINSVPVGGTVYVSGIVDAIFGLIGVFDVTVSVPSSNQTSTATQKRIPGTITIT